MRLPEIQQRRQPVGFRGLALQLVNLQLERIVFAAQLLVVARSVLQREVMAPSAANVADALGAGALKRRNRAHGPDAQQASLRVALDLHSQQHYLQHDDACKQHQRFMSRGCHGGSRFSKTNLR